MFLSPHGNPPSAAGPFGMTGESERDWLSLDGPPGHEQSVTTSEASRQEPIT
jgi:hypothetical protein